MKYVLWILVAGLLAAAWWAFSPLLFDTVVDDQLNPELAKLLENQASKDENIATTSDVVISDPAPIIDTPTHPASGFIRTITSPNETIVRFENYDGTNGPDLFVYLTNDLDAEEFVSLGRAKGNQGNLNYTVPEDVNVEEYRYVITWCKAFGVLFDYAEIN